MDLYTGKQRKNPTMWMNYVTSDAFLDAALGPALKRLKGNEFAILQSFLDDRHLNGLADAGRWDQEAIKAFRQVLGRYSSAYIRERCEQKVTPDCERHPAGVRVFLSGNWRSSVCQGLTERRHR